jgi:pyruvate dehydrogenase E2 component (dihydrolipoamide acetyltransferase)
MAQENIAVPNIGDSHDVDVVEVLVKPGAHVDKEQTLIVLESEKASMDVPSPRAGVVKEVKIKVGDKASEGTPILVLETEEAGAEASEDKPEVKQEAKPADKTPDAEPKPESKSDQGAREEERAAKPKADEREAKPSQPSAARDIRAPSELAPRRTAPPARPIENIEPPPSNGKDLPFAIHSIRRLGLELGVDLARVQGSARGGRITKDDVQGYVKGALRSPGAGAGLSVPDAPDIDFSQFGEIASEPLTKIQRLTGRNTQRSWLTIPHVTQFDEADITELEEFRKQIKSQQPELKLTLLTFFIKALVPVLKAMPRFNASLDKSGENLVLKKYFHIGVAVDTPNGLVVPVIRDVDRKGLAQLATELGEVSERARARKLAPNDMQGASMTISSLGGIGGTKFTPIINPPEVAILGVSRASFAPVYQNGAFVPRLMVPLSLSYDHRVIDGADGARFTTRLRAVLSDIRQLLL